MYKSILSIQSEIGKIKFLSYDFFTEMVILYPDLPQINLEHFYMILNQKNVKNFIIHENLNIPREVFEDPIRGISKKMLENTFKCRYPTVCIYFDTQLQYQTYLVVDLNFIETMNLIQKSNNLKAFI